jgi:hypothetical protein
LRCIVIGGVLQTHSGIADVSWDEECGDADDQADVNQEQSEHPENLVSTTHQHSSARDTGPEYAHHVDLPPYMTNDTMMIDANSEVTWTTVSFQGILRRSVKL